MRKNVEIIGTSEQCIGTITIGRNNWKIGNPAKHTISDIPIGPLCSGGGGCTELSSFVCSKVKNLIL